MSKKLFISKKNCPLPELDWKYMGLFIQSNPIIHTLILSPILLFLLLYTLLYLPITILTFLFFLFAGMLLWTVIEYLTHRFVFHLITKVKILKKMVYLVHGAHHDYPNDKRLYLVGPLLNLPAAIILYTFFYFTMGAIHANPFFIGLVSTYIIYDWMHYSVHTYNFQNRFFQKMKKHHMLHHFQNIDKGFGFTTTFWDKMFQTNFEK